MEPSRWSPSTRASAPPPSALSAPVCWCRLSSASCETVWTVKEQLHLRCKNKYFSKSRASPSCCVWHFQLLSGISLKQDPETRALRTPANGSVCRNKHIDLVFINFLWLLAAFVATRAVQPGFSMQLGHVEAFQCIASFFLVAFCFTLTLVYYHWKAHCLLS